MATEVTKEMSYNNTVNVYLFWIIFWKICSPSITFAEFDKLQCNEVLCGLVID